MLRDGDTGRAAGAEEASDQALLEGYAARRQRCVCRASRAARQDARQGQAGSPIPVDLRLIDLRIRTVFPKSP